MNTCEIWTDLERSGVEIARRVYALRSELVVSVDDVFNHASLAQILRIRSRLKRGQIERARDPASRRRLEVMGSAITRVADWWDAHPHVSLRQTSLAMPPDVGFVLWFRNDTREFLDGFETRNASKLSYERGKAFFGDDWEPLPDPNVP